MQTANPAKHRIPVIVLSGFLGSGKTTLLNRLLAHAHLPAIIVNEFGSTPIDQQLLRTHNIPLSTLAGGCLCCQVQDVLTPLLKNLRMAWEAQPKKPFECIFIETSGVANPEPILDTLLRQRWLAARYRLEGMIATVSAVNGAEVLARFPEAQAQIAWADKIIITHSDRATETQMDGLLAQLARLAPAITPLQAVNGLIDPAEVMTFRHAERYRLQQTLSVPAHNFYSVSLQFDQPFVWERLQAMLETLLMAYPKQLLRLKGLVYTLNESDPLVVQGAVRTLFPPVRIPARVSDDGRSRLVFITDGELAELPTVIMEMLQSSQT
jgi:G3E family GTPase